MNCARGSIRSGTMSGPEFAIGSLSDDARELGQRGGGGGVVVVCCERKGSSQARDMKLRPVVSFSDMITVGWKKWEIFRDNQ